MITLRYEFGDFSLDASGVLQGPGGEVPLRPQAFRLLLTLVSHPDRVLSKDELLDAAWGVEHLSPSALKQTVSELRRALGDSTDHQRFIQTLPRRGYRFVQPVRVVEPAPAAEGGQARASAQPDRANRWHLGHLLPFFALGSLAVLVVLALLVLNTRTRGTSQPATAAAARAEPSSPTARPIAAVLDVLSAPEERPLAERLAQLVGAELMASGTEEEVPRQLAQRADEALRLAQARNTSLEAAGEILGATMLVIGTLERTDEDRLAAQIVLFDQRTGQAGGYAVASAPENQLPRLAADLITSLWAWNEALVPVGEEPQLMPLDFSRVTIRSTVTTGTVLKHLRPTMAELRASAATRPPRPQIAF